MSRNSSQLKRFLPNDLHDDRVLHRHHQYTEITELACQLTITWYVYSLFSSTLLKDKQNNFGTRPTPGSSGPNRDNVHTPHPSNTTTFEDDENMELDDDPTANDPEDFEQPAGDTGDREHRDDGYQSPEDDFVDITDLQTLAHRNDVPLDDKEDQLTG